MGFKITKKENYLRAIYNRNPEWVPENGEAVKVIRPPVCERPETAQLVRSDANGR